MSAPLKKERLDLRLAAEAKGQIEKAAALQGRSVSDFVVAAALTQAAEVIEQQMVLKLCLEDSSALADTFVYEPEPSKKAMEAAERYRKKMGNA